MSDIDRFEPKFSNQSRIPIVLHIGRSGKKSHLSYADIDRCNDTGELCFVPYASHCGSAKWSRHSGKSGETVMQHTGTAKITCKKCGVKTIELNSQGYDIDNMRTYHEVYNDVMVKNMIDSLPEEEKGIVTGMIDAYNKYKHECGVSPRISIDGKMVTYYDNVYKNQRAITTLDILTAIYDGKEVSYMAWNRETREFETKTIHLRR